MGGFRRLQSRYRRLFCRRQGRAAPSLLRGAHSKALGLSPVESFVDDLKPNQVLYRVRAALLQRSLEIQPVFSPIRMLRRLLSLSVVVAFAALLASVGFFLFFINMLFGFCFSAAGRSGLPFWPPFGFRWLIY